jgi:hypothetical protein
MSTQLQNMLASSRSYKPPSWQPPNCTDGYTAFKEAAHDLRLHKRCTPSCGADDCLVPIMGEQDMGNRSPTGDSGDA